MAFRLWLFSAKMRTIPEENSRFSGPVPTKRARLPVLQ